MRKPILEGKWKVIAKWKWKVISPILVEERKLLFLYYETLFLLLKGLRRRCPLAPSSLACSLSLGFNFRIGFGFEFSKWCNWLINLLDKTYLINIVNWISRINRFLVSYKFIQNVSYITKLILAEWIFFKFACNGNNDLKEPIPSEKSLFFPKDLTFLKKKEYEQIFLNIHVSCWNWL